ncbi:MAG: hypothetical protein JWL81_261 [Verrucomicrobiales bacterium]|nr:hypothetical protein [Verrucomicrobiales bacterium]
MPTSGFTDPTLTDLAFPTEIPHRHPELNPHPEPVTDSSQFNLTSAPMKTTFRPHRFVLPALAAVFMAQVVETQAQTIPVTPTTPTKFDTKKVGAATATNGATITPSSTAPTVRRITYLTLSPLRQWTGSDGKTLTGKLIAWEETVDTSPSKPLSTKPITEKPTLLKDNRVRLLIDNKAFEVPLTRLGAEDRKFILNIQENLTKS